MPATTHRARTRLACCLTLTALALALTASGAGAASPVITRQATSANAVFLAYAPAPPAAAKALCLVDSGVNASPDTTPGLVSATALDGGTGADVDPLWHGTIDAAIAGGSGYGVLGAWPQLKIVSVRATDVPSPGQKPSFQFDDYVRGITQCSQDIPNVQVAAIALPLSSVIPPTPDQEQEFATAVALAQSKGISVLAAAGNEPGPVQLPGSQPGILAVGAGNRGTIPCSFSPTTGLTFFAPGCGLDQIDTAGNAFCCGNGTSQASAFAAGVLVALRSYDPALTAARAVELLLTTTHNNGQLDATAAFRAAGLGAIVDAGNAATPKAPVVVTPPPPAVAVVRVPRPSVSSVTWHRGVLTIRLRSIPKDARLHARVTFAHRKAMNLVTTHLRVRARTPRPRRVQLHQSRAGVSSATVTVRVRVRR
jgi:Subtilase family